MMSMPIKGLSFRSSTICASIGTQATLSSPRKTNVESDKRSEQVTGTESSHWDGDTLCQWKFRVNHDPDSSETGHSRLLLDRDFHDGRSEGSHVEFLLGRGSIGFKAQILGFYYSVAKR